MRGVLTRESAVLLFVGWALSLIGLPPFAHPLAGAHEGGKTLPGPGSAVGGTVDRIVIDFEQPVTAAEVSLTDPNDKELPGEAVDVSAHVRFEMEPLATEGEHIVRYKVTRADGEIVESAYAFRYDKLAPPLPNEESSKIPLLIGGAAAGALLGVIATFIRRKRASSSNTPTPG